MNKKQPKLKFEEDKRPLLWNGLYGTASGYGVPKRVSSVCLLYTSTTTCENLGIGLAMEGKKVLLVDADPQGSLTISMGWQQPDELPTTLSTLMAKAMNDQCIPPGEGVLHHAEGVDLIPANIELAGMEVALVNTMSREKMLKQVLDLSLIHI